VGNNSRYEYITIQSRNELEDEPIQFVEWFRREGEKVTDSDIRKKLCRRCLEQIEL
jgi:hypothetical protein